MLGKGISTERKKRHVQSPFEKAASDLFGVEVFDEKVRQRQGENRSQIVRRESQF